MLRHKAPLPQTERYARAQETRRPWPARRSSAWAPGQDAPGQDAFCPASPAGTCTQVCTHARMSTCARANTRSEPGRRHVRATHTSRFEPVSVAGSTSRSMSWCSQPAAGVARGSCNSSSSTRRKQARAAGGSKAQAVQRACHGQCQQQRQRQQPARANERGAGVTREEAWKGERSCRQVPPATRAVAGCAN